MNLLKNFKRTDRFLDATLSSCSIFTSNGALCRGYKNRQSDDGCRRACVDIPPEANPVCPDSCNRWGKRKNGILHKIKLKIMEGGSNFGTPFRRLECKEKVCKEVAVTEPQMLPDPSKKPPALPPPRPGVQISIIGADTNVGQYIALLLKQCPCVKKRQHAREYSHLEYVNSLRHLDGVHQTLIETLDILLYGSFTTSNKNCLDFMTLRLYEAKDTQCSDCSRDLCKVVQDIQHIDTNCVVEAFSCVCNELEKCLQNSDVVVILESGDLTMDMPLETRFCYQAPIVKQYADAIAKECPNAFIIVCTSPIDCMVPLIAETLKETGWYNPRKLLGSLAVPEMRASTLAARALCLEPSYVHVPCVGGTEGSSLVPLFSRALEYFDFSQQNSKMMTQAVRSASQAVSRYDGNCTRAAELSEAHALTGLVSKVAWALLCKDVPRVTGFVETDASQVISPSRFIANTVEITGTGIVKSFGLPKMSDVEMKTVDLAINELYCKHKMVDDWYCKYFSSTGNLHAYQLQFTNPRPYERFDDCAYANI